jgi:peptidoglycan/LPS O-acetylase OafA/YrhL
MKERFHSLDALRAFALLLGVALHAAMAFMLPPGFWAVGTTDPATVPSMCVFYVHSFRMEVFFLLAGFFSHLVIGKRGLGSFLRDRCQRIILVFVVALYPMKFLLSGAWMIGGRDTGWLQLPPEVSHLAWWQLALGGLTMESWPAISLTHLWFLYYLILITAFFLSARRAIGFVVKPESVVKHVVDVAFRRLLASWFAPIILMVVTLPLMRAMDGAHVETPDKTFAPNLPVLTLYGVFFVIGWFLRGHADLLATLSRRGVVLLTASFIVSVAAAAGAGAQMSNAARGIETPETLRLATAAATCLTMNLAVLGWVGLFERVFRRPLSWVRYLADASYWIYLVHLPVVVALQIASATWTAPWWIKWPFITVATFGLVVLSYHWGVRKTWIGAWLNGRRPTAVTTAAEGAAGRAVVPHREPAAAFDR